MIRVLNIAALAITVSVSFGLYKLKYNTSVAEDTLRQLQLDIEVEEQALRVLRAEWSHLNRADRIQALTDKYLNLKPVDPEQIARVNDIPMAPMIANDVNRTASRMGGPLITTFEDSEMSKIPDVRPTPKPKDTSRGGEVNG